MNTILQQRIEEAAKRYAWSHDTIGVDKETFHTEASQNAPIPIHKEVRIPIYHEMEVAFKCAAHFILNNQWISVDEALPEDFKKVFFRAVGKNDSVCYGTGYVNIDDWYTDIQHIEQDYFKFKITHWMPIPSLEGGEG